MTPSIAVSSRDPRPLYVQIADGVRQTAVLHAGISE